MSRAKLPPFPEQIWITDSDFEHSEDEPTNLDKSSKPIYCDKQEPTLTEMARYIVEHTGGCWHERGRAKDGRLMVWCTCGWESSYLYTQIEELKEHCKSFNPTYTDDAGKVELLRLMIGREDFEEFVMGRLITERTEFYTHTVTVNWYYLTDKTGKLLDAAYNFLKEKETT